MERYKLDIVLCVMGLPMTGDTLRNNQPLGGSETAALQMAFALAKQGHKVTLFCNCENAHQADDVWFMPFGWVSAAGNPDAKFPKGFFDYVRSTPHDILIIQRQPSIFQFDFQSKVNLLWQHDLATKTGPSQFGHVLWNLDKVLVLSQFMKHQYQSVHGGPDSLYHVTRNGVDLTMIDSVPNQERDRFKLMYTARPERGLDILLTRVWPEVLKREPRARLYLSRYQDPTILPLYTQLSEVAKQYGDSVIDLGHLGKNDLYTHYKQARLFVYPSVFEEISHITSQEVGGCGTVMIGPWRGACPETCRGAHVLIRDDGSIGSEGDAIDPGFQPVTDAFVKAFVDETIRLIHDDNRWNQLSLLGRKRAEQWQWEPVVNDWVELCYDIIAKKTSDTKRMVKHFLVKSDVVAAKKYADFHKEDPSLEKAVDGYIEKFVPFMHLTDRHARKQALSDFYERRSGGAAADYRVGFWADREPRLKVLTDWLAKHPEVKSLLDFGCAHGGYARAVSVAFPSLFVRGVDISPALIRCCNEMKTATLPDGQPVLPHPENVSFTQGDEEGDYGEHDCVVCMDTLEHLPDAEEVAEKLEKFCKPGGWMVFTVPVPDSRERSEFVMKGIPPVHVRSFDKHDVVDLFGHRKEFTLVSFSDLTELELDKTFGGWWFIAYRKDDKKIGKINWQRKFTLQAPRETLAVCLIVHNNEDVLHRCLRSVQKIADQIIVLDNGPSTDRTVDVALEYTKDVKAGTSPFFCYTHLVEHPQDQIDPNVCQMAGFETPRNESIEDAWTDWCLWLDSDEQLLEWERLWKYLRPSVLLGYAMKQHHIAVDPPGILKQDIPVRLFRNHLGIRFIGCVHEHAETGVNKGVGPACLLIPDVHIHHDGYLTEPIRRRRFWRNFRLLQCDRLKYPDRILGKFLYDVRDRAHLAKYGMEQSGGVVTPEVREHWEAVVKTFRENFLAQEYAFLAEDALGYYSEALTYLGEGVEVAVSLDVKPQGAALNGAFQKYRLGSQAEAKTIIDRLIAQKFAPFEGPYSR